MAASQRIAGLLLAAGRGRRFDPAGERDKLLQDLPDGHAVAIASARHLLAAVPEVLAVVRPGAGLLMQALGSLGCRVTICPDAAQGMGHSLAHAVASAEEADGWIIALADMPFIRPATIAALRSTLQQGADIVVPVCGGRRGNPVGFSSLHRGRLLASSGDEGARRLLQAWPVTEVGVDDGGIFRDIDVPQDLA